MGLLGAFLLDTAKFDIWIAERSDNISGSGSANDPYNGATRRDKSLAVSPSYLDAAPQEARVSTEPIAHHFVDGDVVSISGVTGSFASVWNGTFGIYDVTEFGFKYFMKQALPPAQPVPGSPICVRLTFRFDEVMRQQIPAGARVHLGPGIFQTRGFAMHDSRGWQPKSGQKIVGTGLGETTLQMIGADNADEHYHAIGMPIEPDEGSTTAITPLESFEISDITIDCNVDNQPGRPNPGYASIACGGVRIFGNQCRISRVKAINWGTKTFKQACFVLSITDASGQPTGIDGNPIITETIYNGIEDCIAVQPSRSCARETTVMHLGGVKNSANHAQGFAGGPFIRRNFVDCQFQSTPDPDAEPPFKSVPYSSGFITSKTGTLISGNTGIFVGKRPHFHIDLDINAYARFYNPRDPMSRWNGYFQTNRVGPTNDKLAVTLGTAPPNTNDDSSFVIMGTEFRAIAVTSGLNALVEQNQIHNCWIGGPYQSPLDDSVNDPSTPPTLTREEHLDPLNALNIRSLVVRANTYKNVAIGPYFNGGGISAAVTGNTVAYDSPSGLVTVTAAVKHKLWVGARVVITLSTAQPAYDGLREITAVSDFTFSFQVAAGLAAPAGTASYQIVSGLDFLTIENNVIELADLDATEYAIKEYPLAPDSPAQTYRAYGIVVGDNGLSAQGGPYVHRQVMIHRNTIRYLNTQNTATVAGLGNPAGAGMQLAGIGQLQVTHNVLDTNIKNTMRTFRCGKIRFFNNKRPDGRIRPGWKGETNGYYDEPETLAEDALIITLLQRGKK